MFNPDLNKISTTASMHSGAVPVIHAIIVFDIITNWGN
jgi:hypothetical protein